MRVELTFHRNLLDLDAGQILSRIEDAIKKARLPFSLHVESVTLMSRWLIVLVDFQIPDPNILSPVPNPVKAFQAICYDVLAGLIVDKLKDYAVRYRHFTIHGEGPSLIHK